MKTVSEEVKTFHQRLICDQDGCNGEMLSTGEGVATFHAKWLHKCGKCGFEAWIDAPQYPRIVYRTLMGLEIVKRPKGGTE